MTAALRDAVIPHDDDRLLVKNLVTMALGAVVSYVIGLVIVTFAHQI